MNEFSNWLPFDTDPDHHEAAVYEFRLVLGGRPLPLGRMLASDPDGLLVIGCTKNMDARCCQSRSGRRRASGSSTMNLLFYLERYTPLLRLWPSAAYEYRFAVADSAAQAKEVEERRLKRYFRQFGELPPLNSVLPNRYGEYGEPEAV